MIFFKEKILFKIEDKNIQSQRKEIAKIDIADNYYKRLKGLMFKKEIAKPLVFKIPKSKNKNRSAIHSCFMRFEIAIVFIDFKDKIYEIANLKPWQFYSPKKPAKYIIEFKKEEFNKINLKINDKIEIK